MGQIVKADGTEAVVEHKKDVIEALNELYALKETMPEQWALIRSIQLEEAIIEFNLHAEEHDLDCIVAFKCTPEERETIIANMVQDAEEILDDDAKSKSDNVSKE